MFKHLKKFFTFNGKKHTDVVNKKSNFSGIKKFNDYDDDQVDYDVDYLADQDDREADYDDYEADRYDREADYETDYDDDVDD